MEGLPAGRWAFLYLQFIIDKPLFSAHNKAMQTKYGEINNGDIFMPADGTGTHVKVTDVDLYSWCDDIVVERIDGVFYRIDVFKLMMVRYYKSFWKD